MKVRVKQAHAIPAEDGRWIDHPVDEELEIEEKDFAGNLHERIGSVAEEDKREN